MLILYFHSLEVFFLIFQNKVYEENGSALVSTKQKLSAFFFFLFSVIGVKHSMSFQICLSQGLFLGLVVLLVFFLGF